MSVVIWVVFFQQSMDHFIGHFDWQTIDYLIGQNFAHIYIIIIIIIYFIFLR
jgi:hypothetical protein